jgi:hypothetical protein
MPFVTLGGGRRYVSFVYPDDFLFFGTAPQIASDGQHVVAWHRDLLDLLSPERLVIQQGAVGEVS